MLNYQVIMEKISLVLFVLAGVCLLGALPMAIAAIDFGFIACGPIASIMFLSSPFLAMGGAAFGVMSF